MNEPEGHVRPKRPSPERGPDPAEARKQLDAFVADVKSTVARLKSNKKLTPGQISEVVEVSGEQPAIDTITDTLGGTVSNKLINELPLQGRDFQNLLELRPGIQRTPGGGFHSVTTNGNRFEDNKYTVDGTDDNDIYYGESVINDAGVAGTPASHLPLDAIQEFNTQENQSAEYGWKPGAVVNVGLKSGSNNLHGTAYYFHRNSAFDARNYFNRSRSRFPTCCCTSSAPQLVVRSLRTSGSSSAITKGCATKWNPLQRNSPVSTTIGDPEISLPMLAAAGSVSCSQGMDWQSCFSSTPARPSLLQIPLPSFQLQQRESRRQLRGQV
jgi:hypothetical protein